MRLRRLLECVPGLSLETGFPEMEVTGVCCDSRRVTQGVLYAAIPGVRSDGHDFLDQAAKAGAVAALVSRDGTAFPGAVLRAEDPRAVALCKEVGRLYCVGKGELFLTLNGEGIFPEGIKAEQ